MENLSSSPKLTVILLLGTSLPLFLAQMTEHYERYLDLLCHSTLIKLLWQLDWNHKVDLGYSLADLIGCLSIRFYLYLTD